MTNGEAYDDLRDRISRNIKKKENIEKYCIQNKYKNK